MPLSKVVLTPGINTMASRTLNKGGYSDCNLVRFRAGLPEKMGGWRKAIGDVLQGFARTLLAFTSLAGDKMLAAGTHSHIYVVRGGSAIDITPIDRTLTTAVNGISVTDGSTTVRVTTTVVNDMVVGDRFTFDTVTGTTSAPSGLTVGGIVIAGEYLVTEIVNPSQFRFEAATPGTSTATGGSGAAITCFLPTGMTDFTPGLGWGAGGWGLSGWGMPASVAASDLPARIVSLDAWGQGLIIVPTQDRLFSWFPDEDGDVTDRAQLVTNATPGDGPPERIYMALIGAPERHVILLGCSDLDSGLSYDPMLVRWSDVDDYTSYRASSTNSAGSYRLQGGAQIMGARSSKLTTLIWSDTSLFSMRFIGLPYVYAIDRVAVNCGLIAQLAHAELNGTTFWMAGKAFWLYQGGSPKILPCTILEEVFGRMTVGQAGKVHAGVNTRAAEVWWFYPADGSTECNRYAAYNTLENLWYGGALTRTVWSGEDTFDNPIGIDPDGQMWNHEVGTDADGAPMGDFIETGYWDMADGEAMIFASQLIPDFTGTDGPDMGGEVQITVLVTDYPNRPPRVKGPYPIRGNTLRRGFRARGRQMALRIEGMSLDADWRLGALRVNTQADGMR